MNKMKREKVLKLILYITNGHSMSPAECFPSHSRICIYLGNCSLMFQNIERDIEQIITYLFTHEFLHLIKEDEGIDSKESIIFLIRTFQFELIQSEPHYIFNLSYQYLRKYN